MAERFRILMVNAYGYLTGGADLVCHALAGALRERGHEVSFVSTESERNVISGGFLVPLRVTHFNRDALPPLARARVARDALWNPEAADRTREAIAGFSPDVVHAHKLYPQLSVAPIRVAREAGVPIVQSLYDYEFLSASMRDHTGRGIDRDESRASYRALNTVTFPIRRRLHAPAIASWTSGSRYLASAYRRVGIEARVVPWFVAPQDGELPDVEQRRGIVFAGRLTPEKGVEDVLALAEANPELSITVAGAGPLSERARDAAARLGNLSYLGSISHHEVRELLRRARLAVMPSRWQEPGGLAALEAMSVGTPVVAYSVGGLAEYVGDAGAGRVVEPSRPRLATACMELYAGGETWAQCSRAALASVRGTHSPERHAEAMERIFAEAVS